MQKETGNRNCARRHTPPPASCKVRSCLGTVGRRGISQRSLSTFSPSQVEVAPLSASSWSSGNAHLSLTDTPLSLQSPAVTTTKATSVCVFHKLVCLDSALQMIIFHTEAVLTRAGHCSCALTVLIIPTSLQCYYRPIL